jgi:hypothetical protein
MSKFENRPESRRTANVRRRTLCPNVSASYPAPDCSSQTEKRFDALEFELSRYSLDVNTKVPLRNRPRRNATVNGISTPPLNNETRQISFKSPCEVWSNPLGIEDPRPNIAIIESELDNAFGFNRLDWETKSELQKKYEIDKTPVYIFDDKENDIPSRKPISICEMVAAKTVAGRLISRFGIQNQLKTRRKTVQDLRKRIDPYDDIRDARLDRELRAVFASFATFGDWKPHEIAVPGLFKSKMGFRKFSATIRRSMIDGKTRGIPKILSDMEMLEVFKERADPLIGTTDFEGFVFAISDLSFKKGICPSVWLLAVSDINQEKLIAIHPELTEIQI